MRGKLKCLAFALLFLGGFPQSSHAEYLQLISKLGKPVLIALGTTADLVTLFGLDVGGDPPKMDLRVSADATNFSLTLTGGGITKDFNDIFTGTAYTSVDLPGGGTAEAAAWTFSLDVNLDAGTINDAISINGNVTHVIGPHLGDSLNGPQLTFNTLANADNAVDNLVTSTSPVKSGLHFGPAQHLDILRDPTTEPWVGAKLTATVSSTAFFDDITGYTFQTGAIHVPEPTSTALFILGLAVLIGHRASQSLRTSGDGNASLPGQ